MPLLWALACGSGARGGESESAGPAPVAERPRGIPKVASEAPPPASPPAEPTAAPFRWGDDKPASEAGPKAEGAPDAEVRDYGAELRAALGNPASCLKARSGPDAPTEISIEIEAYVMAAGNVSRGYASSAQLAPDEIECIRKRIEPLRFRTPIQGAPTPVRTTLKLALESQAKTGT